MDKRSGTGVSGVTPRHAARVSEWTSRFRYLWYAAFTAVYMSV